MFAAKREALAAWLNLARELEELFGPMAEEEPFRNALLAAIDEGNAFCSKDKTEKDTLSGGVVVDQVAREVVWLAVSGKSRKLGAGALLLNHAIEQLGIWGPIKVVTFADTIQQGLAARELYLKYDFRDREPRGENPAGFPVVLMVRADSTVSV